jgi:hypothetical protein
MLPIQCAMGTLFWLMNGELWPLIGESSYLPLCEKLSATDVLLATKVLLPSSKNR